MAVLTIDAESTAKALIEARLIGHQIDSLPGFTASTSMADAYAVQDVIIKQSLKPVAGWKIGATSVAVMRRFNSSEPFSGPMFMNQMHSSPANVRLPSHDVLGIESEFSFWIRTALPPRTTPYLEGEVAAAIGGVAASIEVVASRLKNVFELGVAAITADHGVNLAWLHGERQSDWKSLDLTTHEVHLQINGTEVAAGIGGDVLGCPLNALVWLANHLSARGYGLAAGAWVSSGSCTNITPVRADDRVVADFGSLGEVVLTFIESD